MVALQLFQATAMEGVESNLIVDYTLKVSWISVDDTD